jgi:hypothetical protein
MRSPFRTCALVALLLGALGLGACGANPAVQAEPAPPGGVVLPTPPPMPATTPLPPTQAPPAAPAAVAPAAGDALAAADFAATDLGRWSVMDAADALIGPSVWKAQNGRLSPVTDAQDLPSQYGSALLTGDANWRDYSVSAAAYVNLNDEIGVVARASERGYYVFKLLPAGRKPAMLLARYEIVNHQFVPLATAETGGFETQRWYTLRLEVKGDRLTAYVDGTPVLEAQDSGYTQGRAGVYGYPEGGLEFDNFAVQALASSGQ